MPSKKELETYGSLIYFHKPTIKSLIFNILEEKLFSLKRKKQSIYTPGAVFIPEPDIASGIPLQYVALISGQKVVEMIRVNSETADIIMNKKTKFVKFDPKDTIVKRGYFWTKEHGFSESKKDKKNEQKDQI